MVTTRGLVGQVAMLHEALDRLDACSANDSERDLVAFAAQDVVRAWVQTCRRARELERAIAAVVTTALDRTNSVASADDPMRTVCASRAYPPRTGEQELLSEPDPRERYSADDPVAGSADSLAFFDDPKGGGRAAR